MTITKRVGELITDLESILISASDLLRQIEMKEHSLDDDCCESALIIMNQNLSELLVKVRKYQEI